MTDKPAFVTEYQPVNMTPLQIGYQIRFIGGNPYWRDRTRSTRRKDGRIGSRQGGGTLVSLKSGRYFLQNLLWTMLKSPIPPGFAVYPKDGNVHNLRVENFAIEPKRKRGWWLVKSDVSAKIAKVLAARPESRVRIEGSSAKIRQFKFSRGDLDRLFVFRADGEMENRVRRSQRSKIGMVAGCLRPQLRGGPRKWVRFSTAYGVFYEAVHRLNWFFHNGPIPPGFVIDHIDRDQLNNRLDNLRCITPRENRFNNTVDGFHRVKGTNRYDAHVCADGVSVRLGGFDTPAEARRAYLDAKKILHHIPA